MRDILYYDRENLFYFVGNEEIVGIFKLVNKIIRFVLNILILVVNWWVNNSYNILFMVTYDYWVIDVLYSIKFKYKVDLDFNFYFVVFISYVILV